MADEDRIAQLRTMKRRATVVLGAVSAAFLVLLLELLLGRDLQFIRINGTVVGGLAGSALHSVVLLLR